VTREIKQKLIGLSIVCSVIIQDNTKKKVPGIAIGEDGFSIYVAIYVNIYK